jgi:hypothetical protein
MLRIAYVAPEGQLEKPKKLTKREVIHQAAMETIALKYAIGEIKAKELLADEIKEVEDLEEELLKLKQR